MNIPVSIGQWVRRGIACMLAAAMALWLTAETTRAQEKEYLLLTGPNAVFAPFVAADKKGFFKEEGLNVSHRIFASGADAVLAFQSVGAHFLAGGDIPSMVLWSQGAAVGIAAYFGSTENLQGVVNTDIKSAQDLKGKKIGTKLGSTAPYLLYRYLKKAGMSMDDVEVINLSPPDLVPAFVKDQIDGFFIFRPFPQQALKIKGDKAHILTTTKGMYVERLLLSANANLAKENPEVVVKFLRALQKAIDFIDENPEEAAKLVADRLKTKPEVVQQTLELKPFSLVYTSETRNDIQGIIDYLEDQKLVKTAISLDMMNTNLLKQVDPALVTD